MRFLSTACCVFDEENRLFIDRLRKWIVSGASENWISIKDKLISINDLVLPSSLAARLFAVCWAIVSKWQWTVWLGGEFESRAGVCRWLAKLSNSKQARRHRKCCREWLRRNICQQVPQCHRSRHEAEGGHRHGHSLINAIHWIFDSTLWGSLPRGCLGWELQEKQENLCRINTKESKPKVRTKQILPEPRSN